MCKYVSKNYKGENKFSSCDCILQEIENAIPSITTFSNRDDEGYCIAHSSKLGGINSDTFKYIVENALQLSLPIFFEGFYFNNIALNYPSFNADFVIENCTIDMLELSNVYMDKFVIKGSKINSIDVINSHFNKYFSLSSTEVIQACSFKNSTFDDTFYLSDMIFDTHYFGILNCVFNSKTERTCFQVNNVEFKGDVEFTQSIFNKKAYFYKTTFCFDAFFNNNLFFPIGNTVSGYYSLEFDKLITTKKSNIHFKGSKDDKSFKHQVFFNIKEFLGKFYFENVLFNNIDKTTRDTFLELSRTTGQVVLGDGCLKYKYQTNEKFLPLKDSYKDIILDIANVFGSFFEKTNTCSLGLEVTEKTQDFIKYIYFSDDISIKSQEDFEKMLEITEIEFWQIFNKVSNMTKKLSTSNDMGTDVDKNKTVQIMDTIIDLTSILTKLGLRTNFEYISEDEKLHLLNVVCNTLNFGNKYNINTDNFKNIINVVYNNSIELIGNNNNIVIGNDNSIMKNT